jgi:hypothetical protein
MIWESGLKENRKQSDLVSHDMEGAKKITVMIATFSVAMLRVTAAIILY